MVFFDANIVAETVFAKVLNIVYGWSLKNLNHYDLNAVAVDLGDDSKDIAVQVTSQRYQSKIQDTLDKFINHGLDKKYKNLKVFIIGKRTGKYSGLEVPSGISFSGKDDVIDDKQLVRDCRKLETAKVKRVAKVLDDELNRPSLLASLSAQSDEEALRAYRSFFERSALTDPWHLESDYEAFREALTDLISILNSGYLDNQHIAKRRFSFESDDNKEILRQVVEKLQALRQLFTAHVRSGEINLDNNTCNFRRSGSGQAFDAIREGIIEDMNFLLQKYSIKELPGISKKP